MSLEPVMGRDRTYRFSQPVWAQASSMSVILRRLTDLEEPAHVRAALARALRTNRGPWHAEALGLLRTETDDVVRARLMESLSDAPAEMLSQALSSVSPTRTPRARLGERGRDKLLANYTETAISEERVTLLVTALADEDEAVRAGIVRALSFRADLGLVEKVAARLGDRSPMVRLAAVDAVARLDPSGARARVLDAGLDRMRTRSSRARRRDLERRVRGGAFPRSAHILRGRRTRTLRGSRGAPTRPAQRDRIRPGTGGLCSGLSTRWRGDIHRGAGRAHPRARAEPSHMEDGPAVVCGDARGAVRGLQPRSSRSRMVSSIWAPAARGVCRRSASRGGRAPRVPDAHRPLSGGRRCRARGA